MSEVRVLDHRPGEYLAIAMWGKMLRSTEGYIADQQARASEENAPIDAIYKGWPVERWITIRELDPNHSVRIAYEKLP